MGVILRSSAGQQYHEAKEIIRYVYTGEVEITKSNAKGMIAFAKTVQHSVLEKWGIKFLINNIDMDNLASTWDIAKSLEIKELTNACIQRMKIQFESFVYTDAFVQLKAETVLALLRDDTLAASSEEFIFAAISRWTCACKENENEKLRLHVPAMLKEVQWDQTTSQFRQQLVDTHPIFQKSSKCARLMDMIIIWIGTAAEKKNPCPFNQHARPPRLFFVFGKDKEENRMSVRRFDIKMRNEQRVADMECRWDASYSVVGGSIFAIGGKMAEQIGCRRVDEFVVREGRWRTRAPLAGRRQQHAAAVVKVNAAADQEGGEKSFICVFGGCYKEEGTFTWLASCEVYDVGRNRWHKLPDLPEKRVGAAAAVLPGDDRMFVFGGHNGPVKQSVLYCRLLADWHEKARTANIADFWIPAAPMPTARHGLAAAAFRGNILVAGGNKGEETNVNVLEMFSPPQARCPRGQWTTLASMNHPRRYFSLLNTGDAVYALGNAAYSLALC